MDYSPLGTSLAAWKSKANNNALCPVIDDVSHKPLCVMGGSKGHSNRVFAVKYATPNVIVSGGWDNCVHIWDVRSGTPVRTIYGPTIGAAQGLDVDEKEILTASNRGPPDQLQRWDLGSGQLIESETLKSAAPFEPFGCLLGPPVVVVGHANNVGEARIGDTIYTGFQGPCTAVARNEHMIALVSADGVRVVAA